MMNANSLYVSTMKIALQANSDDLTDLCRLIPYLRQSLSCTVCGNLLVEPYTPTETNCQHHVCNNCRGGKKKLKPACSWCKNYDTYEENLTLRSLMQCYKKMCEYLVNSSLYRLMSGSAGESNIKDLIDEGAGFRDECGEFKSAGLSKSAYSILPCIYTHTSTQTSGQNSSIGDGYNGDDPKRDGSLYSVMYAGTGHKMVIKRKIAEESARLGHSKASSLKRSMHRKSGKGKQNRSSARDEERKVSNRGEKKPRVGCRCGNATVTPGKLTCCGQRCPCYVVAKACLDCKCRGCRNPHTKEGQKVIRDVLDLKAEPADDDLDSEILQMGLDDLSTLDQVLELRSDPTHHDLDLL